MFLFINHFLKINAFLYNSMIEETDDICTFKVKLAKDPNIKMPIVLNLMKLPLIPEYHLFSTTKWPGLPWEIDRSYTIAEKDLVESVKFYYIAIKKKLKTCHYYSVTIEVNNITVFTNPIYKTRFGFFYPVFLNHDRAQVYMGRDKVRGFNIHQDDFNTYFWTTNFPPLAFGAFLGCYAIYLLISKILRRRRVRRVVFDSVLKN